MPKYLLDNLTLSLVLIMNQHEAFQQTQLSCCLPVMI